VVGINRPTVSEPALLLTTDNSKRQSYRVARVLEFFGISSHTLAARDFAAPEDAKHSHREKVRVLSSAEAFLQVIGAWERNPDFDHMWPRFAHSIFIYLSEDADVNRKLVRVLSPGRRGDVCELRDGAVDFAVSDRMTDFCGIFSGIRTTATRTSNADLALNTAGSNVNNIISAPGGAIFLKLDYKGVPTFVSGSREIINIDAELVSQNFDVRQHFASAVPLVLYIKWAFAESCWTSPEVDACLVIDDPVLKPRHGFIDFEKLLLLMKQYKFSTNVAFIPWNWRRSSPKVVGLFKNNPEYYSLSVHGCDHVRAEFGGSDRQRLYYKAQQAIARIKRHESNTGIRHDRVMVFPQGIFSETAIEAIKRTDLIAAVNNDILLKEPNQRSITLSDMWDVAVMNYSAFAIFTRRYPWEGVENFAFDALLGKPAIIVIHHDYCSDHCSRLINFIERLNALEHPPTWRSLGEVVRRSCRQRELSSGEVETEMYAAELRVENRSTQSKRFLIRRRESAPSAIREISNGPGPIAWNSGNGHINFEIELSSGESKIVSIRFHELAGNGCNEECNEDNLPYRFKAMLRRYLCEIRDNYVTTTKLRLSTLWGPEMGTQSVGRPGGRE
jgi:hypothetical protein